MTTLLSKTHARYRMINNSIAPFLVIERPDGSIRTEWLMSGDAALSDAQMDEDVALQSDLAHRLEAYFAGEPVTFDDVPVLPGGGPFIRRCWSACRAIPAGETLSYTGLAARAGSPHAARAAGQAMRTNPLPIIIPCHRVLNAAGALHGYAGQTDDRSRSLDVKRRLLALEGASEPAA